jgi:hypothetical protein
MVAHQVFWPIFHLVPASRPTRSKTLVVFFHLEPTRRPLAKHHHRRLLTSLAQHPLPSRGKINRHRCPFYLLDSPFPLPIFSPTRNGCAIEAPLSRRRLLLDRPPPIIPRPIKDALEHRLHTTFPVLASARSIRACIALPQSSKHRRLRSSTPGHHSRDAAPSASSEDPEGLLPLPPHSRQRFSIKIGCPVLLRRALCSRRLLVHGGPVNTTAQRPVHE